MKFYYLILPLLALLSGFLPACATAPVSPAVPDYVLAASGNPLLARATPTSEVVGEIYHWVHTSDYPAIEKRLRESYANKTVRLYAVDTAVQVKYASAKDVYIWSAKSGQIRRGTWTITEAKFGPQICETFYGQTNCLNTVEVLSGVGQIGSRAGDSYGLARGGRPIINGATDGVPDWP